MACSGVAAICLHNGISMLWTADRDFSRFPELKTSNPLIAAKK
jgi:predicted nucleic acid-binding protein